MNQVTIDALNALHNGSITFNEAALCLNVSDTKIKDMYAEWLDARI